MAIFEVIENEGVRLVKITLNQETVRAESGALYYMRGPITMESKAPSVGGFLKAMATGETIFRPTYTGSGELYLEPNFTNFHVFELGGQEWILERGAYWASDGSIEVDVHRDSTMTSLLSGQGFLNFQTKVKGFGKVVVVAQGDVQEMVLTNDRLVVDGTFVVARTGGLKYRIERATKSLLGSMSSGEGLTSTFEGTGKVLIAPIPYWRLRMISTWSAFMSSTQQHK
ncbi:MAG: AIM24 family protein [Blastocatellia bacterium]|nr:AIM24 family protein [Blastocatellia bacterium]